MNDWVRNDLAGKGARRRTLIRGHSGLIIAPLWLIPTTTYMHRRCRRYCSCRSSISPRPGQDLAHASRQRRPDPELVDEIARQRDAHIREAYRKRHGHADG
jgi:hypothetical protein